MSTLNHQTSNVLQVTKKKPDMSVRRVLVHSIFMLSVKTGVTPDIFKIERVLIYKLGSKRYRTTFLKFGNLSSGPVESETVYY